MRDSAFLLDVEYPSPPGFNRLGPERPCRRSTEPPRADRAQAYQHARHLDVRPHSVRIEPASPSASGRPGPFIERKKLNPSYYQRDTRNRECNLLKLNTFQIGTFGTQVTERPNRAHGPDPLAGGGDSGRRRSDLKMLNKPVSMAERRAMPALRVLT